MNVAVVTCSDFPQLDPFDRGLVPALQALGATAGPVVWSDPAVDWGRYQAVVIRSAWDSHLRREAFQSWADRAAKVSRLYNPPEVLRWNLHKRYLRELESAGVPVTPTEWVPRGGTLALWALARSRGWRAVVVKPAVSASARETHVFREGQVEAQVVLDRLAAEEEVLVQPYLEAFETEGERSYIFIGGAFSHAVRRPPTLKTAPRGFQEPQALTAVPPRELAIAESALAECPPVLYARVDFATDNEGQPRVQEVELTEPCLFLSLDAQAASRLARAIVGRS